MAEENKNDNEIFVGKKPSMSYVLAAVTQFGDGKNEIFVKARGRSISKAVDVAEIVKNKFVKDAKIKGIEIGTDEIKNENGEKVNVSSIAITLTK